MKKMKLILSFALLSAIVFISSPVASQDTRPSEASGSSPSQIVYGLNQEPGSLNAYVGGLAATGEVTAMITESLFGVDPDGNWYPVLATEIPTVENGGIAPDGLTITYHLRNGVVWSDGKPFTCDDVLFTYEALTHPTNSAYSSSVFSAFDSVSCPDDFTAEVRFKLLLVGAPYFFGFDILPRHAIGDPDNMKEWSFNRQPVGTGPFRFVDWIPGDHIALVKNDLYRGYPALPKADSILIRFVEPTPESLDLLRNEEIDILWNYAPEPDSGAQDDSTLTIHSLPGTYVERLVLNLADPTLDATDAPLGNPHWALGQLEVRQAIQLGIDKQAIVDTVQNAAAVGASEISSGWAQCDIAPSPFDPVKARSLLEEAGWADQNKDGVRECTNCANAIPGTPLRLKIRTTAGNAVREQVEAMLADMMKAIGIELYAENLAPAELFGGLDVATSAAHGNFDILMYASGAGVEPQGVMWSNFHSSQIPTKANSGYGGNYSRWIDEQTDEALMQAGSPFDPDARKTAYQTVCERVTEGLPLIYLYDRTEDGVTRSDIQGFSINPFAADSWNAEEWERVQATVPGETTPVTLEAEYTLPLTVEIAAPIGITEPLTIAVQITVNLKTLTLLSGQQVVSDSLTAGAEGQTVDGVPFTITMGAISRLTPPADTSALTSVPVLEVMPTPMPASGTVNRNGNVRSGPGTDFDVTGSVKQGQKVSITSQSQDGTWYLLADGTWIAAFLVDDAPTTLPASARDVAHAYLARGADAYSTGQYDRALEDFTKSIEMVPDDAVAYLDRCGLYILLRDNEKSILDCNKAIELDPNLSAAYHNRANAYNNEGEFNKAVADSTRAIELNPTIADAYAIRGIGYMELEEYELAVADFEVFLKLAPVAPNRAQIEAKMDQAKAKLNE